MIANFIVATVDKEVAEDVRGSLWDWTMRDPLDASSVVTWRTVDPISSREVVEGNEYIIVCIRLSTLGGYIGPDVSAQFKAEITQPPVGNKVAVCKSITVGLQ